MKLNARKSLLSLTIVGTLCSVSMASFSEVKVGFLGAFTGPIESLTPPILSGAQLAMSHINSQGSLLDGQVMVMPTADTTCVDASAASNAGDRLVNSEKVVAVVGGLCSGATIAAANNAGIPGNVLMVSPASTSPALTDLKDNDLVFRTAPSDAYQGEVMARLLKSKGIDEVAITYVNNDYGKGFADALAKAFEKLGGSVAAKEAHEDGKADYRAELGSLASTGAQNLVVLAYADGSGQTILRQAIESGDFSLFVGGDGMVGNALISALGADALKGMIATKPGTPDAPGTAAFSKLASTVVGFDPKAVFAAQAYDAAFLIGLAIEEKGSADREGMSEALRKVATAPGEIILPGEWAKAKKLLDEGKDINYQGAAGNHEFDANGDVPGVIVEMGIKNGKFVELGQLK
ncbi:ABC transporter substrate-binding protein [Gynuella sp.]|uniref:ABC transporter substrate-binding protein n=1 Tax=Gynuella sp. TaxID=2969146 RepID=UPI003D0FBDC7